MLNKSKSTRNALLKYGLSVPLFAGMLVLSSAGLEPGKIQQYTGQTSIKETPPVEKLKDTIPGKSNDPVEPVFTEVEEVPEFPGGMMAFYNYLGKNFKYPKSARKNNVSGKVILSFIVEKDGQLSDIKVIRGLNTDIDQEAVRVLKASPKWKPGLQNGHTVRVAYTLPIAINLNNIESSKVINEKNGGDEIVPPSSKNEKADISGTFDSNNKGTTVTSVSEFYVDTFKGLIIIDGIETNKTNLNDIDPNTIESLNMLKDASAIKKYGDKGKEGVIEITTKKK